MRNFVCAGVALLCLFAGPTSARTHKSHSHAHKAAPAPPAQPPPGSGSPAFLGAFKDWSAYARGSGEAKVCYVLSQPKAQEPARAKRDPAYFLVNDWPARRSKGEAEVVPGYQYREGGTVTVQVGSKKIAFFTKNDGKSGGAWVLNPSDQDMLLDAMRHGITAVVTGTSKRGTETKDVYGLGGFGSALDAIHSACGM